MNEILFIKQVATLPCFNLPIPQTIGGRVLSEEIGTENARSKQLCWVSFRGPTALSWRSGPWTSKLYKHYEIIFNTVVADTIMLSSIQIGIRRKWTKLHIISIYSQHLKICRIDGIFKFACGLPCTLMAPALWRQKWREWEAGICRILGGRRDPGGGLVLILEPTDSMSQALLTFRCFSPRVSWCSRKGSHVIEQLIIWKPRSIVQKEHEDRTS